MSINKRKIIKGTRKRKSKYKSDLERLVARMLGRKARYEQDRIAYVLPKTYIPDYTILLQDGHKIYLEVKGWLRVEDQRKMKAVKFSNPTADIRFFFPRDQRVQGSKMLNSEWCKRYNFVYCIGKIPKGWITINE